VGVERLWYIAATQASERTEVEVRTSSIRPRRGGRKRIVAPDGAAIVPSSKPQPAGTLVKALARSHRWQRMLDEGVYPTVSEIGDAENISKSYVSRILRLALLAPDIVDTILAGKADRSLVVERLERPLPAGWGGTAPLARALDETVAIRPDPVRLPQGNRLSSLLQMRSTRRCASSPGRGGKSDDLPRRESKRPCER
jgi:hypothetical protein